MRKNLQSKKDIIERLNVFGVKANRFQTKVELQKLLRATEKRRAEKLRQQSVKRQPGVKVTLYRLFTENPGLAITEDELIAKYLPGRKPSSIRTWIGRGGLGSEKYGMKVGGKVCPILIVRDKDKSVLRRTDC